MSCVDEQLTTSLEIFFNPRFSGRRKAGKGEGFIGFGSI